MESITKIRVAVLYGGCSAEHEVSLQSAANVIQHLDRALFEVVPIGIDKQGKWFLGNEVFQKSLQNKSIPQLKQTYEPWFTPEWIKARGKLSSPVSTSLIETSNPPSSTSLSAFDVVFPVVHGTLCEDGTLQGLLALSGLPYVGCGVLSSAINMDKDVSKRLAAAAGIPIAPFLVVKYAEWQKNTEEYFIHKIQEQLSFPVFVKPANTGSSIGVSKVKTPAELSQAIKLAFSFDRKIVIEQALEVSELEIAVLESHESTEEPIVSVVGEVRPTHEFYSYEAKYLDEHGAALIIPAPIPPEIAIQAQEMAKKLFILLECEGMARIDLFLSKDTKQLYFNEINTIPGFTQISMYPKLMQASGISYTALLTHLIELALKKQELNNSLTRNLNAQKDQHEDASA